MLPIYTELIKSYSEFCKLRSLSSTKYVDLSSGKFFFPTTLLPTYIYSLKNNKKFIMPKNESVRNYVELCTGQIAPGDLNNKTYIAIEKLPKFAKDFDTTIGNINNICTNGDLFGGANSFNYYLSELCDNIYEHADFKDAYVLVQKYEKQGFVEIVIVDDGCTIPGSFEKKNIEFDEDGQYLIQAVNGLSTKKEEGRGKGLGTSMIIIVEGLRGQIFVASRNAALYKDSNRSIIYKLKKEEIYSGTLITIRLPYPAKKLSGDEFNEYIEN